MLQQDRKPIPLWNALNHFMGFELSKCSSCKKYKLIGNKIWMIITIYSMKVCCNIYFSLLHKQHFFKVCHSSYVVDSHQIYAQWIRSQVVSDRGMQKNSIFGDNKIH